jgi:hypothetical protein
MEKEIKKLIGKLYAFEDNINPDDAFYVEIKNLIRLTKKWLLSLIDDKKPLIEYEKQDKSSLEYIREIIPVFLGILGTPEIPQFKAEIIIKYLYEIMFYLEIGEDE